MSTTIKTPRVHTAGPWRVGHFSDIIVGPKAEIICNCEDNYAANARLIAACPTMYDYISKKAGEGDAEAQSILATIR